MWRDLALFWCGAFTLVATVAGAAALLPKQQHDLAVAQRLEAISARLEQTAKVAAGAQIDAALAQHQAQAAVAIAQQTNDSLLPQQNLLAAALHRLEQASNATPVAQPRPVVPHDQPSTPRPTVSRRQCTISLSRRQQR